MQALDFAQDIERTSIAASGLWRLTDTGVIPVDRSWAGPATVLAPNEDVLLLAVDLPFASRRQRQSAAPFAVEAMIGQPLDQVHVALGMEISDRRHLCGVVRRETMIRWIALLDRHGLGHCILTPDALVLTMPPMDAWQLMIDGDRALVRSGDATGFAIPVVDLPTAWEAAGRPRLFSSGAPLPEMMQTGMDDLSITPGGSDAPVLVIPPLDLRQGDFAAVRSRSVSPARTLGLVIGLGVLAHLAIFSVDTFALDRAADRAESVVRRRLAEQAPGIDATNLAAAVDRVAPAASGGDGAAIAMMTRTSRALAGQALAFRSISFTPDAATQLAVTAPNIEALNAGVRALASSGLAAEARLEPLIETGSPAGGVNAAIAVELRGGG